MSLRSGKKYTSENVPPVTQQGREKSPSVQQEETRSHVSRASRSSKLSSASSLAARARAKAEATRVQLAFAEKEAIMLREKADLDAKLHILRLQSAAAAAAAEAAAYIEDDASESEKSQEGPAVPEKPMSSAERTSDYVQNLISVKTDKQTLKAETTEFRPKPAEASSVPSQLNDIRSTRPVKEPPPEPLQKENQGVSLSRPKDYMSEQQSVQDITRYLIRKEMVNSSFSKFDDCPENYWAWKSSFLSAIRDLNLSASEVLDLMIKWLGTESAQHAKSMRRVHLFHPSAGLDMAWQRLEERYGSPEVIEGAFLKKLKDFPKLNNKDNTRLQELGDLLLEIECAKEEGFLPGLAYLDTAQGINPVAEKLPYPLQIKWTSVGAKYKEENRMAFPPFFVFSRFVQQQAKIRCDPSFAFIGSGNQLSKPETPARPHSKTHVSTHKTTVPPAAAKCHNSFKVTPIENLDNECPLHHKPHSLKSCNGFRRKPIKERMSFLKQNGICFKCCETTKHIAKDCKTTVYCSECGSATHITALHPDLPLSSTETVEAGKDQDREQEESSLSPIVTKCTEVCGQGKSSRSCSKICLVTVYPSGRREKAAKMYAVLDEHSNRSLARSEFFDIFNIKSAAAPYTLKTCAGTMETAGRSATDFIIESFDGKKRLPLPTLIECDMIPEDRTEIPSPEVAHHYPHLHPIAHLIPVIDPDAPMLLLLGRDILQAHKVRQQINGVSSAPYAQRLDLGWVVIGDVCLGSTHQPDRVCTLKTSVLANGRASFFSPCLSSFTVKENFGNLTQLWDSPSTSSKEDAFFNIETDNLGVSVFQRSEGDDKQAPSIEDQVFLQILDRETYQDDNNSWVAPLPFRKPRSRLPCNREQAMKRLHSLRRTLQRKSEVKEDFTDLPEDRVNPEPPFTSVGVDVFGPWSVVTRRTRGGSADSKRWAVLFTCLSTRAVHLELIESMSASSFINALRRFFSIRGPAKIIRSDRGTNFVGACKELNICASHAGVQDYLQDRGCTWIFNPPHSSHMGGAWERLIGVARRILDAMLLRDKSVRLTHETLSTFMSEVMAIMNARPLVPVSTDPDNPLVLTPAMLLTQKTNSLAAPSGNLEKAELHVKQWKQVQCLADTFWKRWRREYLCTLQTRRKWIQDRPNVKAGDVVLLKDSQENRNDWPVGVIINTLPSRDGKVRKVEVRVVKQETAKVYVRPVSDIIVLVTEE